MKRNTPFGQKLVKIFKDYKSEIKKIVWLSKKELIRQTGIVVVTVVIAAVFLGGLDWAFSQLIQLIA
ncbi:MAG: preprotein translocase subunit SecE [Clostridiales bacterium GWF2_36_10]|nr:MAG: preprotein translocase subunit SecE [Clostridiales bacterium GWF2_36_10]